LNREGIVFGPSTPEKREFAQQLRREQTPAELLLWERLRAGRLAALYFRRQQVIDGFIVDFYCHTAGLVVECDGEIHQAQIDYDTERDQMLTARGLHVLRFGNPQVLEAIETVIAQIRGCACSRSQAHPRGEALPAPLNPLP
jgi:very-short-patch-repair endonuclease